MTYEWHNCYALTKSERHQADLLRLMCVMTYEDQPNHTHCLVCPQCGSYLVSGYNLYFNNSDAFYKQKLYITTILLISVEQGRATVKQLVHTLIYV